MASKTYTIGYKYKGPLTSISVSGQKRYFNLNDTFTFGGTVTAHYSNGATADVTNSAIFDTQYIDMSVEEIYPVYVYYTEDGITVYKSYNILVSDNPTDITFTRIIEDYANMFSWVNGRQYLKVQMTPYGSANIVRTGATSGTYNKTNWQWRVYQSDNGGVNFIVDSLFIIKSLKITYASYNTGQLEETTRQIVFPNGTAIDTSSWNTNSITLMVTNSSESEVNGYAGITQMEIIYGV